MNKYKQAIVLSVDPRVVECPYCFSTTLITEDLLIEESASGYGLTDTFICPSCHHVFCV